MDVLGDYVRLTENVQKVLDWRLSKLADLQQAERDLQRLKGPPNLADAVSQKHEFY